MLEITKINRTCYACPSQWDATTKDDRQVYIRYRWGNLSVNVSKPKAKGEFAALDGDCVFCNQVGDGYDGMMEYADLKNILESAGVAKLPETSEGEEDATYDKASELFAKASESLNKMIEDGTVKVIPRGESMPRDATMVTQDKEAIESHLRRGQPVVEKLEDIPKPSDS